MTTLKVYFSRKYSFLITAISLFLVVACIFGFRQSDANTPFVVKAILSVVGLSMCWGLFVGAKMLIHPPLMFRADQWGITNYYDSGSRSYKDPGQPVPWKIVRSMELKKIRVRSATNRPAVTWVIACKVDDPAYPEGEVYLNAWNGTVTHDELLRRLNQLREFSSSFARISAR